MEDLKALEEACVWQEERFQFMSLTRDEALRLGNMLVGSARKRGGGAAVAIVLNGLTVFQYVDEGAGRHNVEWIGRKVRMVDQFGKSSLRVYAEFGQKGIALEDERLDPMQFALCGGGFPLKVRGVGAVGAIAVSGLPHLDDHQAIVDALTEWFREIKR